jgi:2-polyprenyl-3-methyl-5-hydroxy-6-metoxy-1,4-benzoquinol methylase
MILTLKYFIKNIGQVFYLYGLYEGLIFFFSYFKYKKVIKSKIISAHENFNQSNPGENFNKYLNTNFWIFENLKRIYELNLHKKEPQSILDLGAGAGYFPYLCIQYGHTVTALDMKNNEMYNQIISLLGIHRIEHQISFPKDLPLPANVKYDLVTAFMICFNNHKQTNLWHIDEWDWFLTFLSKRINKNGKVFLSFNEESIENPIDKNLVNYLMQFDTIADQLNFTLSKKEDS